MSVKIDRIELLDRILLLWELGTINHEEYISLRGINDNKELDRRIKEYYNK